MGSSNWGVVRRSVRWTFILLILGSVAARAQVVTEFPIPPTGGGAGNIAAGRYGDLWFVVSGSGYLGEITTAGDVTQYAIPTSGSEPRGIAVDSEGIIWFTEASANKIGKTRAEYLPVEFPVPTPNSRPTGIAAGPDGNMWFTEATGGSIGRITPAGVITEFSARAQPYEIAAGPDGNLWFTDYYGDKIGRITTSGVVTLFSVPFDTWPSDITAGPDGNLWILGASSGSIRRMSTAGVLTGEFPLPPGFAAPESIAAGPDGNLWFTKFPNTIGRITTSGVITEFSAPQHPSGIAAGPDGNLWFIEATANAIGRMEPAQGSPCVADATSLCLNDGRFRVTVEWNTPAQGSGHGTALPLTDDTGAFWFFDAKNIEVVVKVLNGCSSGGHYWVFAAGLTNLEVLVTVTDMHTAETRTYTNPAGQAFAPIQDTGAFSACP